MFSIKAGMICNAENLIWSGSEDASFFFCEQGHGSAKVLSEAGLLIALG